MGTGSPGLVSSQVLTQTSSTYIPYRHVFQDVVVLCEWSSQAPGAPGSASPPIPPFSPVSRRRERILNFSA